MSVKINDSPDNPKTTPRDEFAEALKQAAITIGKKGLMQFLTNASNAKSEKQRNLAGAVLVNHRAQIHGTDEEKSMAESRLLETFYNLIDVI